jgi:hypothetical protein
MIWVPEVRVWSANDNVMDGVTPRIRFHRLLIHLVIGGLTGNVEEDGYSWAWVAGPTCPKNPEPCRVGLARRVGFGPDFGARMPGRAGLGSARNVI